MWSARERTIIARTKQYLEESYSVEVEELEDLLGPDDVDVDFRKILKEARDERGCAIFETFRQMVRVKSRWSVVRVGTSKEIGTHLEDKIRLPL